MCQSRTSRCRWIVPMPPAMMASRDDSAMLRGCLSRFKGWKASSYVFYGVRASSCKP